ncbi:MAG: AI-2E family transporter [Pirellulales bacterium]
MAASRSNNLGNLYVPRVVSFIVLLAIILLVGIVFFQVMAQFIVPLFLACVLLVVFQPLHRWYLSKTPRWPKLAALLTTLTILVTVLAPTIFLGVNAYKECASRIYSAGRKAAEVKQAAPAKAAAAAPANEAAPEIADDDTLYAKLLEKSHEWADWWKEQTGITIAREDVAQIFKDAVSWVGNLLPELAGAAIRIVVGLLITIIALYYFFADGPAMINGLMGLSPMDKRHELELLARFAEISRSVVVATLLSAVVQGVCAGIGFYFALPSGAPIFLLMALTMVLAIVPFVGAAGVWIPTCIIIFLFGPEVFVVGGEAVDGGDWKVAAALAVYCAVVVSGIDNVIKPLVLHGQANLHPLLALLSILGGIQVLGPVGILIGPMLVSFLQALLTMFRREIERWEDPTERSLVLSPTAQALAEHIEAAVGDEGRDEKPSAAKSAKQQPAKKKGR